MTAKENVLSHIKTIYLEPERFQNVDGTISNMSTGNSTKEICVITEDRGNGFQFILSYILANYPFMRGVVVGLPGNGGFRYVFEEYANYDGYVIILDRGTTERVYNELSNLIKEFKLSKCSTEVYVFQPECLEEVMMSFSRLDEYIDFNEDSIDAVSLVNELKSVLIGKTRDVGYDKYKSINASTPEQVCEELLYKLTKGTPFEYFHGQRRIKGKQERLPAYMSPCWRCPCCTVQEYDSKIRIQDCKQPDNTRNKMEYIAKYSLLSGLTYILDKMYSLVIHDERYWRDMATEYFNKLVKEL